jgi:hypothetical protein
VKSVNSIARVFNGGISSELPQALFVFPSPSPFINRAQPFGVFYFFASSNKKDLWLVMSKNIVILEPFSFNFVFAFLPSKRIKAKSLLPTLFKKVYVKQCREKNLKIIQQVNSFIYPSTCPPLVTPTSPPRMLGQTPPPPARRPAPHP